MDSASGEGRTSAEERLRWNPAGDLDLAATPSAGSDRFVPNLAPTLANGILAAVFCAIGLVSFISVLTTDYGLVQVLLGLAYLTALLGLQLGYFSRPRARLRPPITYIALVVQAALVYLPMLQFGESWIGLPGLLAGSVLLALRPSASLPLSAVIVASMGWLGVTDGRDPLAVAHLVISAVITCLLTYGLTRLARLVDELHSARDELARLAVAEERLRFSRDVHDLLGLSLSAITLKSELTNRLIAEHPQRAREELTEILDISRKALADARSVASGYRELSLEQECRTARSILTAAKVDARIEWDVGELSSSVSTVLATVTREGVTNVLRHSKAEWCEITVRAVDNTVRIDIVNDGVVRAHLTAPSDHENSNGLHNLSHRVRTLGGELVAAVEQEDTYRLYATIPLEAVR